MSSDGDLVAVVLFNTRETSNPLDLPNIYVLQDLERPGAEKILGLEKLTSSEWQVKLPEKVFFFFTKYNIMVFV